MGNKFNILISAAILVTSVYYLWTKIRRRKVIKINNKKKKIEEESKQITKVEIVDSNDNGLLQKYIVNDTLCNIDNNKIDKNSDIDDIIDDNIEVYVNIDNVNTIVDQSFTTELCNDFKKMSMSSPLPIINVDVEILENESFVDEKGEILEEIRNDVLEKVSNESKIEIAEERNISDNQSVSVNINEDLESSDNSEEHFVVEHKDTEQKEEIVHNIEDESIFNEVVEENKEEVEKNNVVYRGEVLDEDIKKKFGEIHTFGIIEEVFSGVEESSIDRETAFEEEIIDEGKVDKGIIKEDAAEEISAEEEKDEETIENNEVEEEEIIIEERVEEIPEEEALEDNKVVEDVAIEEKAEIIEEEKAEEKSKVDENILIEETLEEEKAEEKIEIIIEEETQENIKMNEEIAIEEIAIEEMKDKKVEGEIPGDNKVNEEVITEENLVEDKIEEKVQEEIIQEEKAEVIIEEEINEEANEEIITEENLQKETVEEVIIEENLEEVEEMIEEEKVEEMNEEEKKEENNQEETLEDIKLDEEIAIEEMNVEEKVEEISEEEKVEEMIEEETLENDRVNEEIFTEENHEEEKVEEKVQEETLEDIKVDEEIAIEETVEEIIEEEKIEEIIEEEKREDDKVNEQIITEENLHKETIAEVIEKEVIIEEKPEEEKVEEIKEEEKVEEIMEEEKIEEIREEEKVEVETLVDIKMDEETVIEEEKLDEEQIEEKEDEDSLDNFIDDCLKESSSERTTMTLQENNSDSDENISKENWQNDEDSLNNIKRDFYEICETVCSPHPSSESDHAHCVNNLTERVATHSAESILDNLLLINTSQANSEITPTLSPVYDDSSLELYVEKVQFEGKEMDIVYFDESVLEECGVISDVRILRTIPVGISGRIIGKKGKTKNELLKKFGAELLIYNHPSEQCKQVLQITCNPSLQADLEKWTDKTLEQILKNTIQTTVSNPEWLKPMVPLGKMVPVQIIDMPTIQHIKLRLYDPKMIKAYNKMQTEINVDYSNADSNALLPSPVAVGCICIAMIRPDYFLRAEIVCIYDEYAVVYLFDLGKTHQTCLYYLFKIREKYMKLPFQVIPARMPHAVITNKQFTSSIVHKRFLCDQKNGRPLLVRAFFPRMNTCCEPCVHLYVPRSTIDTNSSSPHNSNDTDCVDLLELLVSVNVCSMVTETIDCDLQIKMNDNHFRHFLPVTDKDKKHSSSPSTLTTPAYFEPCNSKFYEDFIQFQYTK